MGGLVENGVISKKSSMFENVKKKNANPFLWLGFLCVIIFIIFIAAEVDLPIELTLAPNIIGLMSFIWGTILLYFAGRNEKKIKEEEKRQRKIEEDRMQEQKMSEIESLWPYGTQKVLIAGREDIDKDNTTVYTFYTAELYWKTGKYILKISNERDRAARYYTVVVKSTGMFAMKEEQVYRISKDCLQLEEDLLVCSQGHNPFIHTIFNTLSSFGDIETIKSSKIPKDKDILEMMPKYHFSMKDGVFQCKEFNIAESIADHMVKEQISNNKAAPEDFLWLFYQYSKTSQITDADYDIRNESNALAAYVNKHLTNEIRNFIQEYPIWKTGLWPHCSISWEYHVSLIDKGIISLRPYHILIKNDSGLAVFAFDFPFDEKLWHKAFQKRKHLLNDSTRQFVGTMKEKSFLSHTNHYIKIFFDMRTLSILEIKINRNEAYSVLNDN